MTPAILQYRAIEHWDGKLPEYSAGALPLLTFDVSKLGLGMDEATRQKALQKLLAETGPSAAPLPSASGAPGPAAPAPLPPVQAPAAH
jgi:hypothetical protein